MENLNIAIVTEDKAYGRVLGVAIQSVCRSIVVNIFDGKEFATVQEKYSLPEEDGRIFNGFDLILWDGEPLETYNDKRLIRLVDKPSMITRDLVNYNFKIYKYCSAQNMVGDIFEIYSLLTGRKATGITNQDVHIYALAGWQGGAGCTSVAMAVGQELMRFHGKRVLYVSMEELESTGTFIRNQVSLRSMGYYLYNLFKDSSLKGLSVHDCGEFRPFMESYVIRDDFGMEAFRPSKGRNPLVELKCDEICAFMDSLINCGRYDVILVDAGTGLSQAAVTALEMAEKICIVATPTANYDRENHYLQYLMCIGGDDILRKMVKLENKVSHLNVDLFMDDDDENDKSILETSLRIEKGTIYSVEDGMTKILLEGAFAQSISKLAQVLSEPLK